MIGPHYSEAVRALHAGDPAQFIAGRKALVAKARSAGDSTDAKALAALRRPTRAAWSVNLLAQLDPDTLARLLALGEPLRQAHRDGDTDAIRELSRRRDPLRADCLRRLAELAAERGWQPTPAALTEVAETLQQALADPDLAERVSQGVMVQTVRAAGFGPADLFAPLALVVELSGTGTPPQDPEPSRERPAPAPQDRFEQERLTALRELEREVGRLEVRLGDAEEAYRQVRAEHDRVADLAGEREQSVSGARLQAARLRAEADRLDAEAESGAAEVTTLVEQRERLGADLAQADAEVERWRARLAELGERLDGLADGPGGAVP